MHKTRRRHGRRRDRPGKIIALGLAALVSTPLICEAATPVTKSTVLVRVVKTNVSRQPELTLMLRPLRERSAKGPPPKAVVAFCTWEENPFSVEARMLADSFPPVAFALKNDLPILSWNTATLWRTGLSYDELPRQEQAQFDRDFDRIASAWEAGVDKLCREAHVPGATKILLYGLSRGAHWSHRLGLRRPQRFLAIHIHVAGSYDKPTQRGASTFWLVSTGDLDGGHDAARAFYERVRKLGYPAVFKQYRSLGHADCPQVYKLQEAVFKFALEQDATAKTGWKGAGLSGARLAGAALDAEPFVGDLVNESVVRAERASSILPRQQIPLPSEEVALAWGQLRE